MPSCEKMHLKHRLILPPIKNGMGRRALPSYLQFGYIPVEDSVQEAFHKKEQVSRTLEYAYDDYALYTMAKSLGKKDDQQVLRQRAFNYRNVFSKADGMVRGKHADGRWASSFILISGNFISLKAHPGSIVFMCHRIYPDWPS